jgi:ribosomal protein S18 acetylase RimI-like enzyme
VTELVPASRYSHAELAQIFNAGYEGYFTPFTLDEAAFRFMSAVWDDDLDASRVALVEGEPAGIAKLAIRGDRGWIAGVGVSVPHRGRGLGETLMRAVAEEGRARGLREIALEVLVQNEPAIRLYEKLGYERTRELEVWALEGELVSQRHNLSPLALEDALGREERPPWQREDASVRNYEGVEAVGGERGVLVYRVAGGAASLLQCAADDADAARELVESLPAGTTRASWLNGPEGHPLNAALGGLGGTLAHRQHELVLAL